MRSEWQVRREMVAIGRRLYEAGLVAGTDGNISVRLIADRILVTPAGACLGELQPGDLVYASAGGEIPAAGRPTSELPMHCAAYAARADIGAVIHAHPPITTAMTVAGLSLAEPVLPEIVLLLGSIPTAPYATPSTAAGARVVAPLLREHDAIVLDRHGILAVGPDLIDALHKIEKVEQCARIILAAHSTGAMRTLPAVEVANLARMRLANRPAPVRD